MLEDLKAEKILINGIAQTKKNKILLVEDNEDLRDYIRIILSDYEIITAKHGVLGVQQLQLHCDVDLIICDLMMPVMDGYEFINQVKNNDHWRHKPAIILTAKQNTEYKIKALRIGIDMII